MTTPTYRFAVIGLGRRGQYHMQSLEAMEEAKVRCVAVAESARSHPRRREALRLLLLP